MAPILAPPVPASNLVRRGEEGRIAGMLIGCLVGGLAAVSLIYFCCNCVFSPKPRRKTDHQAQHIQSHKPHIHKPHIHHVHPKPKMDAHVHSPRHPQVHGWTHHHHHHHHKHGHHHHHAKGKAKPKKACKKAKQKAKAKAKRRSKRPSQPREPTIRFMPMPPMTAMPMHPAPVAGMGMGMGMTPGMDLPLGDGFIDYGPAPDQDMGLEMGWGMDPNFRLEQFATEDEIHGDREVTCNECCYSFFDSLCGIPPEARDLRREAAGNGAIIANDNEMEAV
ncbi:hypothetical protein Landi51_07827 [Colletotrichum acutatum]